ncbi:DUF6265 family protein [Aurantiacibacter flavus]|uniref:DUF6265 family protein n=1 Tax=Aurantiacibacter flavus TaxID=3145232 RepID=A0ABV0CYM4_9SPHN
MNSLKLFVAATALGVVGSPAIAGPPAELADLSWLEGQWVGDGIAGAEAGETWIAAGTAQLGGHFYQLAPNGDVMFYELMTIVPDGEGSLALVLKHFNADLSGWESKSATDAERFPLVALGDRKVTFGGLIYELGNDGVLHISVPIEDDAGEAQTLTFELLRQ